MRAAVSVITVSGLIVAFWGAAMTSDAQSARQTAQHVVPMLPQPSAAETDVERRARLAAKIEIWARSGKAGRLSDQRDVAPPARRRAVQAERPAPRLVKSTPVSLPLHPAPPPPSDRSTIAPPPVTSAFVRTGGARGYRPPRLDLVNAPRVPTDPIECLTQAIYYESRNESEEGQAAVAEVVINRSRAGNYPRDVCQVVYQRNSRTCQFTFTCDGSIGRGAVNTNAWARAERIARTVHSGRSALLPKTSVNYHANYVRPGWGRRLERVRQIGAHIFYGAAKNGRTTPGGSEIRPDTPPSGGLQFVRIDALDRAYAEASQSGSSGPALAVTN